MSDATGVRAAIGLVGLAIIVGGAFVISSQSGGGANARGIDGEVITLGTVEVTVRLTEWDQHWRSEASAELAGAVLLRVLGFG